MKKKVSFILLILGLLPFVILLCGGIYSAINGFSGLTISMKQYGIDAFIDWIILWSFVYWPTYIIGIVLIIISIVLKRGR